jgi:hypothetical protein
MERKTLMGLATLAAADTLALRFRLIELLVDLSAGWEANVQKMLRFLRTGIPEYTLFVKGNSKLPFYSWSTLPLVTCPGMAECAKWCYSLKAWRYPAAFMRQAQNTILLRTVVGQAHVRTAWLKLKQGSTVRLYVDGDFDSLETLRFWMDLCHLRPDLQVYGYSKSLHLFRDLHVTGYNWPANYMLNVSGGGLYQKDMVEGIPVVRDDFLAVPIPKGSGTYGDATYAAAVRQSARTLGHDKVFVCPGKCGTCTRKGHACGRDEFRGIKIAIGIH